MLIEEAKWIHDILQSKGPEYFPLLNIGCSSLNFRTKVQPFIDELIFKPLQMQNLSVVHCDIKEEEGVDMCGNILDIAFSQQLHDTCFRTILCSNVLEHIAERTSFCSALENIMPAGGILIITVPYIYPFHKDPIDTKFRPSPKDLTKYFPHCKLIEDTITLSSNCHFQSLVKSPRNLLLTIKNWFIPRWGIKEWTYRLADIPNLFRRYSITCVVLKKISK